MARFCTNCGKELDPTLLFCTECGAKVEVTPAEPKSEPKKEEPIQTPSKETGIPPAEEQQSSAPAESAPKEYGFEASEMPPRAAEEPAPAFEPQKEAPRREPYPDANPSVYTQQTENRNHRRDQAPPPPPPPVAPVPPVSETNAPKNTSGVVSMMGFFGLELLFSLPFIGWLICIIMMFAPKNENIKNFARSKLIWVVFWGLIVIGISIALLISGPAIWEALERFWVESGLQKFFDNLLAGIPSYLS